MHIAVILRIATGLRKMNWLLSKIRLRTSFYFILLGVLLLLPSEVEAQDVTKRIPIKQALQQIEKQHGVRFNYDSRILSGGTTVLLSDNLSFEAKLKSIESQTALVFSRIENSIYAIFKTYSVCGYILDGENLSPLEGATIQSGSSYTESNDKGYFSMKIRSDAPTLTIRYLGYEMKQWDFKDASSSICPKILLSVETEKVKSGYQIDNFLTKI